MTKFQLNRSGIEALLQDAVQGALKDEARKLQSLLDQLERQYKGRPVAVIKPALKRAFERDGGSISDPELTEYSEFISQGRHIKVNVG